MGDFSLVLLKLAKPGVHVKTGDVVAEFDPQNQLQRLDDYKDSAVQQENMVKKMLANLAAVKEAHDQSVRSAKADWDKAVLDLKTADVRSAIDAEKFKLTVEENEAKYKQLVAESALVDESQRAQIRANELNRDQSKIEMSARRSQRQEDEREGADGRHRGDAEHRAQRRIRPDPRRRPGECRPALRADCGPEFDGAQRHRQPGGCREAAPGHEGHHSHGRVSGYRTAGHAGRHRRHGQGQHVPRPVRG